MKSDAHHSAGWDALATAAVGGPSFVRDLMFGCGLYAGMTQVVRAHPAGHRAHHPLVAQGPRGVVPPPRQRQHLLVEGVQGRLLAREEAAGRGSGDRGGFFRGCSSSST